MVTAVPDVQTDSSLVSACIRGDRSAFQELMEKHQSSVWAVAYSITGDATLSDDVVQDTFLYVMEEMGRLREPDKLRPWLCGIARNLARNVQRRRHKDPCHSRHSLEDALHVEECRPSPMDNLARKQEEKFVWDALKEIPALYREPLILFYADERSVQAVANTLVISEEAVRQRLVRGRILLKKTLHHKVMTTQPQRARASTMFASILGAIPELKSPGVTAAVLGSSGKSAVVGSSIAITATAALLAPLLGIASALPSLRTRLKQPSRTGASFLIKHYVMILGSYIVLFHGFTVLLWYLWYTRQLSQAHFLSLAVTLTLAWIPYLIGLAALVREDACAAASHDISSAEPVQQPAHCPPKTGSQLAGNA